MFVYVLNKSGEALMPTSPAKARHLLRDGKAVVAKRIPFTIQLTHQTNTRGQDITLGVDTGSKYIGLSATTESTVLFEANVELRNDIVELLSTRRECRRTRRNRKTRYRKAKFLNRVKTKRNGWLAPSIRQKIDTHLKVVADIHKILPITKIIVETASFDIQKLKNPEITGAEYQQGEQLGFWNVREYVLFRDNHTCQYCKGKSGDKRLNVHHIQSRKVGGDSPNNLITLCETCHNNYHNGKLDITFKRGTSYKNTVFMGIMRWSFYDKLKELYPDVHMTFGYITKNTRINNKLPKEHYIDARCISGNPLAKSDGTYYYMKKVRCHNRQIHKMTISKGGHRKLNQSAYIVKGFRLFDLVEYQHKLYYIFGKRSSGYFDIRTLNGEKVNKGSINCKYLKLIQARKTILIERRSAFLPHT